MVAYMYSMIACTVSLGIGAFLCAISGTEEIQRILKKIHDKTRTVDNHLNEMKFLLSEFIDMHAAMKQLSKFLNFEKLLTVE